MLIGQADQPRVREMRWIEPKKETDKIFCRILQGFIERVMGLARNDFIGSQMVINLSSAVKFRLMG